MKGRALKRGTLLPLDESSTPTLNHAAMQPSLYGENLMEILSPYKCDNNVQEMPF